MRIEDTDIPNIHVTWKGQYELLVLASYESTITMMNGRHPSSNPETGNRLLALVFPIGGVNGLPCWNMEHCQGPAQPTAYSLREFPV